MTDVETLFARKVATLVHAGRLQWRLHVVKRMAERQILRSEILATLMSGDVIESYPDDVPFPSALWLAAPAGRILHVVASLDEESSFVHIITAYAPSPTRFDPDGRTRRSS